MSSNNNLPLKFDKDEEVDPVISTFYLVNHNCSSRQRVEFHSGQHGWTGRIRNIRFVIIKWIMDLVDDHKFNQKLDNLINRVGAERSDRDVDFDFKVEK